MSYIDHPVRTALTGIISFFAVAIVFLAAGGLIPATQFPNPPEGLLAAIPHLNVVISLSAVATILFGWRAIRRGRIDRHQAAMLLSVGLFGAFLTLYLYRLVMLGGATPYDGPAVIYRFVYLPILTLHISLAVICIPLVVDAVALALTTQVGDLSRTRHPRVGRLAAGLWIVSYLLGTVVYVLLYWV